MILWKERGKKVKNKFPKPKLAIVEQNIIFSAKLSSEEITILAPWYCLRLLSSGCGFKSQPHHLCFFNLYFWNCVEKRRKINKKEAGIGPFKKKKYQFYHLLWNEYYSFLKGSFSTSFLFSPFQQLTVQGSGCGCGAKR